MSRSRSFLPGTPPPTTLPASREKANGFGQQTIAGVAGFSFLGRQGVRSLIPGYFGAVSPRLGLAYSPNFKTTIRAGIARSWATLSANGKPSCDLESASLNAMDRGFVRAKELERCLLAAAGCHG